jgi:hypothetical protein
VRAVSLIRRPKPKPYNRTLREAMGAGVRVRWQRDWEHFVFGPRAP